MAMSDDATAAVRAVYEMWERGEGDWFEALDPEIRWDFSAYPLPDVEDHGHGREDFVGWLASYVTSWGSYDSKAVGFERAGDAVVVDVHETVETSVGGLTVERDIFHLWTLREGKLAHLRSFRTREEAVAAGEGAGN
jgi:ketosteroid isomerase-like protein